MEARKITVVQTKNQTKSVIMTSATTLGELKDDLRTNGIDYEGMTFYEGLSKTELKTDESILPHDIERNGIITNELVFMLTNAQKKIKSGAATMTRNEVYAAIKRLNLQQACQEMFGKNFTMCKTADLIFLVDKNTKNSNSKMGAPTTVVIAPAVNEESEKPQCKGCIDTQARAAITEIVKTLYIEDYFDTEQRDYILNILGGAVKAPTVSTKNENKMDSPYSQDEINQMFRGMY